MLCYYRVSAPALFTLSAIMAPAAGAPDMPPTPPATSTAAAALQRRSQEAGAACSPEGAWNCMPDSWQRCASGRWSVVMDLAEGTACTPLGVVDDIDVEHDGDADSGGSGGSGGPKGGSGGGLRRTVGACVCLAVLVTAIHQGGGVVW